MKKWPWVKDVAVFAAASLLNLILIVPCGLIVSLSDSPKKGFGVSDLWYWVFATPALGAKSLGWTEFALALIVVNPLIYGAMGWLLWRMFRLMRSKPGDEKERTR